MGHGGIVSIGEVRDDEQLLLRALDLAQIANCPYKAPEQGARAMREVEQILKRLLEEMGAL